jgi:hypothetical protein
LECIVERNGKLGSVHMLAGKGEAGDGEEGGGEGGGAAPHRVRIIETSGGVEAGRPPPRRSSFISVIDSATLKTSRSRIEPVKSGSGPQWLLPT